MTKLDENDMLAWRNNEKMKRKCRRMKIKLIMILLRVTYFINVIVKSFSMNIKKVFMCAYMGSKRRKAR